MCGPVTSTVIRREYILVHSRSDCSRIFLRNLRRWSPERRSARRYGGTQWGVSDAAIDTCIRAVRRVIADTKCRMIETRRGGGHCFAAPVEKVDGTASQAQTVQQAHVQTAITPAMTPEQILCEPSSGSPAPRPAHVVDRCVDLLLGVAIGDAFGAGYAGLSPVAVSERFTLQRYDTCPSPHVGASAGALYG